MSTSNPSIGDIEGLKLQLLKRSVRSRGNRNYVYYITIPKRVVRALGLKERDVFSLHVEVKGVKKYLILESLH